MGNGEDLEPERPLLPHFDRSSAIVDLRVGVLLFVVGLAVGYNALASRHGSSDGREFRFGLALGAAAFAFAFAAVLFWASAKILRHLEEDLSYWKRLQDVGRPKVFAGLIAGWSIFGLLLVGSLFAQSFFLVGFSTFGEITLSLILLGWFSRQIRPFDLD